MINVTKPFLPEFSDYVKYLESIWERGWLTNNGPLVNDLELKLKEFLTLDHLLYLSNGTIALQIAIKALDLKGEIITTPFSYVATTSSIVWEGCKPVFVDIDKSTLNIDPSKIKEKITPQTSAILATHVYGNPCDVEAIDQIAKEHGLKVIYDGAHSFGVKYKGKSIFEFGDISTTSFHATKLFHTIEGGAVATKDPAILKKMASLRNFGHSGPETFDGVGVNGKNSEFHAAMGLVNLQNIGAIMDSRKKQAQVYDNALATLRVQKPQIQRNTDWNYSYYPVIFDTEEQLLKAVEVLNAHWIYPRRYFYPCLGGLPYVDKTELPVTEDICARVLCLPMYYQLKNEDIEYISRLLLRVQNH
ncbi:MAG: DegT/DnrJ/EryC1/StrS family aminotransferase [Flavipsychrobacter sp.]|jgi:dTDP-4-amino-4,6-dideoxygalactose transaminase|nr:DegT/DnrJ/EryC1/StrS family aminotransferase [Flavipsychrobacter sp.]